MRGSIRKLSVTFTVGVGLLFLVGCGEESIEELNGPEKNADPGAVVKASFVYPVALGNRWEYRRVDSVQEATVSYHFVEVTRVDSAWSFKPAYVFSENWTTTDFENGGNSESYYYPSDSGLYLLGYDGDAKGTPLSAAASNSCRFAGRQFNSVNSLLQTIETATSTILKSPAGLIVEIPPKLGLKYPLTVGQSWQFREDNPWPIQKKVTGLAHVSVRAGEFECVSVNWLYDLDADGEPDDEVYFRDDISKSGLVRREVILRDVAVEFIDPFGNVYTVILDISDRYELVAFTVN